MTRVIYKTQSWLASIIFLLFVILNHFQSALNIIASWLPGPRKKYDVQKLKTFKRWVPLNFLRAKKLLRMVSHDLWVRKRKIVFLGNWNPRAWMNLHVLVSTRLTNSGVWNTMEHSNDIVHFMILSNYTVLVHSYRNPTRQNSFLGLPCTTFLLFSLWGRFQFLGAYIHVCKRPFRGCWTFGHIFRCWKAPIYRISQ